MQARRGFEGRSTGLVLAGDKGAEDKLMLSLCKEQNQISVYGGLSSSQEALSVALASGCDYVLCLPPQELNSEGLDYCIAEGTLTQMLEGPHNSKALSASMTQAVKFFSLTRCKRAYFSDANFQELVLLKGLVKAFFLDVDVVGVPCLRLESGIREKDSTLLSDSESKAASSLYSALKNAGSAEDAKNSLQRQGHKVAYVQDLFGRRHGAIEIANKRLYDHALISNSH